MGCKEKNPIEIKKLTSLIYVTFAVLCLMTGCAAAEDTQKGLGIIKTEGGYVSGLNQSELSIYLGIPYAAPPTGDLRWKPPEAAKPWEGIYKADRFSPSCPPGGLKRLWF